MGDTARWAGKETVAGIETVQLFFKPKMLREMEERFSHTGSKAEETAVLTVDCTAELTEDWIIFERVAGEGKEEEEED